MTKLQFLLALHSALSDFPQNDVEERLNFYSEIIEDQVEDGLSEEDAIAAVGSVEEIAAQITAELSPAKGITEYRESKKQLKWWEITLIAVSAPIWFPLVLSALAVVLSLYASLWSVIISLWAVFISVASSSVGGIAGGVILICSGKSLSGIALISGAIICAGLAIYLFYGCKWATNSIILLSKKAALGIKTLLFRKKEAV